MRVSELRTEAKRLGLRRYSRLRSTELIDLLNRNRNNILDEEVPDIGAPVLKTTRYVEPRSSDRVCERKNEIRELEEMLGLRKSSSKTRNNPIIKITGPDEVEKQLKINRIKEINRQSPRFRITQTASALRGFARQIRIQGIEGYIYIYIYMGPGSLCNWSERKS